MMWLSLLLLNIAFISAFNPRRNLPSNNNFYRPEIREDYKIPKSVEKIFRSQINPKFIKEKNLSKTIKSKENDEYTFPDVGEVSFNDIIFGDRKQHGPIFYN